MRGQADVYAGGTPSGDTLAWLDESRELTISELVKVGSNEPALRRLVQPNDPWAACAEGLLSPLNSGGSVVVVVGNGTEELSRILNSERIDR